jgi:hypothetical protein
MTSLIHWQVLAICAMFGRLLAYRAVTARSGHLSTKICRLWHIGQSPLANLRNMPMGSPTIARIATVGKVEAESWQNPPNLGN